MNMLSRNRMSFGSTYEFRRGRERGMAQQKQTDTERIVQALKLHGAQVDGPTDETGEVCYLINNHRLSEREICSLADSGRLSSWDIYDYARSRRQRL